MSKRHFSVVLLSLVFAGVARAALAAAPVDERIFAGKGPGETASVLVVMREQTDLSGAESIADPEERRRFVFETLRAQAEISQRPLVERLGRAGLRYRSFYLVNMLEVEADRSLAEELARRADVSSIAANPSTALAYQPHFEEAERRSSLSASSTVEPNVAKIRAPEVWAMGFTGQGIVVGVADTGLTWDHPALKPHYRGFDGVSVSHDYNWHDAVHDAASGNMCGSDSPSPCDDDHHEGHGTATSGRLDQKSLRAAQFTNHQSQFTNPLDGTSGHPRPSAVIGRLSDPRGIQRSGAFVSQGDCCLCPPPDG